MTRKHKVAVVIPAHCHPDIVKLTVGTLIRTHSDSCDLNIHIGAHSNYSDYCKDLSLFEDLRKIASIHLVDEIDWVVHNDDLLRYSRMHAKNLENLFRQIRYYDFDYVLILDNDVFIKQEFISHLIGSDLAGVLFKDAAESYEFTSSHPYNERMLALPKICPWHLLISRRLYEKIMESTNIIYPDIVRGPGASYFNHSDKQLPVFIDTFGKVFFEAVSSWGMNVLVLTTDQFKEWAHHFFNSSFNFSAWCSRSDPSAGNNHLRGILAVYQKEFPNGLDAQLLASTIPDRPLIPPASSTKR